MIDLDIQVHFLSLPKNNLKLVPFYNQWQIIIPNQNSIFSIRIFFCQTRLCCLSFDKISDDIFTVFFFFLREINDRTSSVLKTATPTHLFGGDVSTDDIVGMICDDKRDISFS